ncbi:proline-rich protein 2-like [Ammospiza caudacuta]|uniref:proline-rich protein 2-like n=1 Tax=Ammospiza caudacuta TaxID=2857398 RepID=UPI00273A4B1B|nr:proline-rich protein 2-like [Ammospiza caudacuta]
MSHLGQSPEQRGSAELLRRLRAQSPPPLQCHSSPDGEWAKAADGRAPGAAEPAPPESPAGGEEGDGGAGEDPVGSPGAAAQGAAASRNAPRSAAPGSVAAGGGEGVEAAGGPCRSPEALPPRPARAGPRLCERLIQDGAGALRPPPRAPPFCLLLQTPPSPPRPGPRPLTGHTRLPRGPQPPTSAPRSSRHLSRRPGPRRACGSRRRRARGPLLWRSPGAA